MSTSSTFDRLVERMAPFWGGELEVFETYWVSPRRSTRTDVAWLDAQCFKELVDGYEARLRRLHATIDEVDACGPATSLRAVAEVREELAHYWAFAHARATVAGPDHVPRGAGTLRREGDWEENRRLRELREEHRARHGELGALAQTLTEGGGATLYASGAALAGGGSVDDAIASACAAVLGDEVSHMEPGGPAEEDRPLAGDELDLLWGLVCDQLRARIHMRNAQFGRVLGARRIRELLAGAGQPWGPPRRT